MRLSVARRAWRDALLLLLLGITMGLPTTVLPPLQNKVFSQPYLIAGLFVGAKGFLNTALAPAVGLLADRTSRRKGWTIASLAILNVPFAVVVALSLLRGSPDVPIEVWSFSIADTVMGLSSVAMSLCFAAVPDRLDNDDASLTAGYSLLNFSLSSGVGMGAVLGAIGDFTACAVSGFVVTGANLVAAASLLPSSKSNTRVSGQLLHASSSEPRMAQDMIALLKGNSTLALISVVVFLDFLAEQMLVSLLLLYLDQQFHMSSLQLGCQLAIVGLTASVSLLFVVPLLQPRLGDLVLMQIGMVANVLSVGLFAFISSPWQAYLPPLGCILSFAVFPTANALAAAAVPRSRGGVAQGVVSGSRTLAEGLSPVLFGWMFQVASGSQLPGWPFLVAAGCVAVALVVSLRIPRSPPARGLMELGPRGGEESRGR